MGPSLSPRERGMVSAMSDERPDETPIQRALRLKQAALDARPKPPRGGKFQRQRAAAAAAGNSKPWMTK